MRVWLAMRVASRDAFDERDLSATPAALWI